MNKFCSICQNNIKKNEIKILPCNHVFCKSCLNEWKKRNKNSCPNCRKKVIVNATKEDKYSVPNNSGRNKLIYVFYHEDIAKKIDITGLACTSFTAGVCVGTLCCTIS